MTKDDRLTPEQMESLKRGIADALAGRVTPLSDVLAAMASKRSRPKWMGRATKQLKVAHRPRHDTLCNITLAHGSRL